VKSCIGRYLRLLNSCSDTPVLRRGRGRWGIDGPERRGQGDAAGLEDLSRGSLGFAPDRVGALLDGDRRFVECLQIAHDVRTLEGPRLGREATLKFLAQHARAHKQNAWPRIVSSRWW